MRLYPWIAIVITLPLFLKDLVGVEMSLALSHRGVHVWFTIYLVGSLVWKELVRLEWGRRPICAGVPSISRTCVLCDWLTFSSLFCDGPGLAEDRCWRIFPFSDAMDESFWVVYDVHALCVGFIPL